MGSIGISPRAEKALRKLDRPVARRVRDGVTASATTASSSTSTTAKSPSSLSTSGTAVTSTTES
jgi:mRNA-degrading endonuclease RelE of RelBE toxin-antitoxin system